MKEVGDPKYEGSSQSNDIFLLKLKSYGWEHLIYQGNHKSLSRVVVLNTQKTKINIENLHQLMETEIRMARFIHCQID